MGLFQMKMNLGAHLVVDMSRKWVVEFLIKDKTTTINKINTFSNSSKTSIRAVLPYNKNVLQ